MPRLRMQQAVQGAPIANVARNAQSNSSRLSVLHATKLVVVLHAISQPNGVVVASSFGRAAMLPQSRFRLG